MAAGHVEGVVAALGRVVLVAGELLAGLQEPLVVEVELGAPGERGVGDLLLRVPAEGGVGLVRLDVRRLAVGHGADAPVLEAHVAFLAQGVQGDPLGEVARLHAVLYPLAGDLLAVPEGAADGVLVHQIVQPPYRPLAISGLRDPSRPGPLLDLLCQHQGDVRLGLGVSRRLHRLVGVGEVH